MLNYLLNTVLPVLEESPFLALFGLFLTGMMIYYQLVVVSPVTLHSKPDTKFRRFLDASLPILRENYWPTFWCFDSRLQTILASFIRSMLPDIRYHREVLTMSDGGEVSLDWTDAEAESSSSYRGPIILFLPGLTGHSQSEYIKSLVNVAHRQLGAKCVVFNYRGRGGHSLKTARTYCASNIEDIVAVVDHIKCVYPESQLMALGVSLGGIMLGNYLVQVGEAATRKLVAAMLISICWDCFEGTLSLEKKGFNLLLNKHLTNSLKRAIKEGQHHFDSDWDLEQVFSSQTIKEFDTTFTSRQFGYSDVMEYYNAACLRGKIHRIKVPVLALNAEDDPFQPKDSIPVDEAVQSDTVAILTTRYGGHIGFMEGFLPVRYHYSDRLFAQFAKGLFQHGGPFH